MLRVKRSDCVLLVVDVQDRLIDTIAEHAMVVQNIRTLMKAAEALTIPILATEQEKLGETVQELKSLLTDLPFRKMTFSCCGDTKFMGKLNATKRRTILICGIETHICVAQTVLDLLNNHYGVMIVRDASSSHSVTDRETALDRMKNAGTTITTTEAVIYELTEKAGTDEFRKILQIIKERRSTNS